MLKVKDIYLTQHEEPLIQHLSFEVHPGEMVQIAGENGAGKTTLLRVIVGLIEPEQGQVLWQDAPILNKSEDFYSHVLYVGHHAGMKTVLSAYDNLMFYQALHQQPQDESKLYAALSQVGLAGLEHLPLAQLSAGQQRRAALARLWLSTQPLWILDEPLTAMDTAGIQRLEAICEAHLEQQGMIVLTTHQPMFHEHAFTTVIQLGEMSTCLPSS